MSLTAAEPIKADRKHPIHPLHHPVDNAQTRIYVRGRASFRTSKGNGASTGFRASERECSHGRRTGGNRRAQMKELAYVSGRRSSNIPSIISGRTPDLTDQTMQAVFFVGRLKGERVGICHRTLFTGGHAASPAK
jgi:hypothetical protein